MVLAKDLEEGAINIDLLLGNYRGVELYGKFKSKSREALAEYIQHVGRRSGKGVRVCLQKELNVRTPEGEVIQVVTIQPMRIMIDLEMIENLELIMDLLIVDTDADEIFYESSGLMVIGDDDDDSVMYVDIIEGSASDDTQSSGHSGFSSAPDEDEPEEQEEEEEEDQPRRKKTKYHIATVSFFICLYYALFKKKTPGKRKELMAWIEEMRETVYGFDELEKVIPSNVVAFLRGHVGRNLATNYKIMIWSSYGTLMYTRKKMRLGEDNEQEMNLTYDAIGKRWRVIWDLDKYFNKGRACEMCTLRHIRGSAHCIGKMSNFKFSAKPGPGKVHRLDQNTENVFYCDTEAYLRPGGEHVMAALGAFGNGKYWDKVRDNEDVDDVTIVEEWLRWMIRNSIVKETYDPTVGGETTQMTIYVYFHNLAGYDLHHVIAAMQYLKKRGWSGEHKRDMMMDRFMIAKGVNKWEAFQYIFSPPEEICDRYPDLEKVNFKFKDSFKMLTGSLANLISDYNKEHKKFKIKPEYSAEKMPFPYDWFDSPAKLEEPKLPEDPGDWYNKLTDTHIDNKDAQMYWDKYNCKNFGDYMRAYMRGDVIGLANVFENLRTECKAADKLDPVCFHGMPSYAFYCAKLDSQHRGKLEEEYYATNAPLQRMFWDNIRGGVTQAIYQKVDLREGDKGAIEYVDVAGLYATAMRDYPMPLGGTIQEVEEDMEEDTLMRYLERVEELGGIEKATKLEEGLVAFVEFDYEGYTELHDRDWQLPLIEHKPIEGKGLINDFSNTGQLYHGLRIYWLVKVAEIPMKTIGKVFTFKQSFTFKSFVSKNLESRQKAISLGQKTRSNIEKLKNNASYGKTMQTPKNMRDVIIHDEEDAREFERRDVAARFTSMISEREDDDTQYVSSNPVTDYESGQTPHMGFTILEMSKIIFYDMWFKVSQRYGDKIRLLYCDTDSMILWKEDTNNLWEDLTKEWPGMFNADASKKILGTWEREKSDIDGVICLQAKSYYVRCKDKKNNVEKHKGVSKRTRIHWDDYLKVLRTGNSHMADQINFKKVNFKIITHEYAKVALSLQNNKRIQIIKERESLPFGYKGEKWEWVSSVEEEQ